LHIPFSETCSICPMRQIVLTYPTHHPLASYTTTFMKEFLSLSLLLFHLFASAQKTATLTLQFDTDKHSLTAQHRASLDSFLRVASEKPLLIISGHTDDMGDERYNQSLSSKRAEAVKNFLKETQFSVSDIQVQYFGEGKPLVGNSSAGNRALNRRTEVTLMVPDEAIGGSGGSMNTGPEKSERQLVETTLKNGIIFRMSKVQSHHKLHKRLLLEAELI
jgi:hypothetical protein